MGWVCTLWMIHVSHKLWFECDYCRTYRQYKAEEYFNQGSPSTLIMEQVLGSMWKPEPRFNRVLEENEQREGSDTQPYFHELGGLCPRTWNVQLRLSVRVPPAMMLPDELWQTRPGNISPRVWQSISDGGGGLCRGVYLYNLICYLVGQLLWQSLQQSLHRSRPHCKSFNDHFSILIIVRQMSAKVRLRRTAALLAVPPELIHHSSAYQSPHSPKIYFPLPRQCLRIPDLTMRPRLQLFSGWRASRAPVNHRLLYLGHSKSSCVMPCYLSSNIRCPPPDNPTRFLSNPDSSLSPPLCPFCHQPFL